MKRVLALTLTLVALSVCAFSLIGSSLSSQSDKVKISERLSYGDVSEAYGAKIKYSANYQWHLLWDIEYMLEKEPKTEIDYEFSHLERKSGSQRRYSGFSMDLDIVYGYNLNEPLEELSGIERAYRELYEATPMYETRSETIYLDDYYTYYPIGIDIDLPFTLWSGHSLSEKYRGDEYEVHKKFKEFFRIPVPTKTDIIEIQISKDGNSIGIGSSPYLTYYVNSISSYSSDKCFFSINNRRNGTEKEFIEYADTSLIPGGYGIYCFEYERVALFEGERPKINSFSPNYYTGIKEETLKMVYPLEKEAAVEYMAVSESENRLFVITEEGGCSYFREIELSSMTTLQKTKLFDGYHGQVWHNDGFFVINRNNTLMLLAPNEKGLYELKFTSEYQCAVNESFACINPNAAMDFDGERLIVIDQFYDQFHRTHQTCDFYIAVYSEKGLLYYGEYKNSLSTNNNYNENCTANGFSVEWKN
ncbi:MAG: hypothetical protein E7587_07900 [Ruminococcaceae bacterium]|nr:hypothetical protein [Oscillospiraceae bacterium]